MITIDNFHNGQLKIKQPEKGYRAGIDAVLLAASVQPKKDARVLDIGCGVGVVSLCLARLNPDCAVYGLERDQDIATLADDNATANKLDDRVHIIHADLQNPPSDLAPNSFDHVVSNPPYFNYGDQASSHDPYKSNAKHCDMSLDEWIQACLRMVKPLGFLTLIHRTDQLDDVIVACKKKPVGLKVLPLQKDGQTPAKLSLVQVRKGSKSHFSLCPGFILHEGGKYTNQADRVFRGKERIDF